MEAKKKSSRRILMFPWLAFGHVSPYMELAIKLSQNNFQIYFCSSPIILQTLQSTIPPNTNSIQFVELNLPSLPSLPPHMHSTKGLPLHLNSTLHDAFRMAAPRFHSILLQLKPRLLITEMFQPWAIRSASSLNIIVLPFLVAGTAVFSYFFHSFVNPNVEYPFSELYLRNHWISRVLPDNPKVLSLSGSLRRIQQWMELREVCSDVVLVKSFREIEDKYIDYLSVLMKKKVVPIGPLVPDHVNHQSDPILEWLDTKELRSTVYVSFGSEYYLSKTELEELGMGLEMSGANFIWVVRFPIEDETKIEEALPNGFAERVGERGIVVNGWAPQLEILKHSSVGGFVSHCGWSSVVEAVVNGVPIIAMPMQLDQPYNARVAMAAGIGIEAERGFDGAIKREGVMKAIKQVLYGESGENFNRKSKEICEILEVKKNHNIEACVVEIEKLLESN